MVALREAQTACDVTWDELRLSDCDIALFRGSPLNGGRLAPCRTHMEQIVYVLYLFRDSGVDDDADT